MVLIAIHDLDTNGAIQPTRRAPTGWLAGGQAGDVCPYLLGPGSEETHRVLRPTTVPGRWSILAVLAFAVLIAIFAFTVAAGQRGGEEFFDNLWLTVPFLGAYLAAVAAFAFGASAIAAAGERSVAVMAATAFGLLVTTFGVLEVAFPH